jgi:2-C-methyl-D-erythritol 2,4-cyclodiphosphate synthase
MKIGFGYDSHRFTENRPLILAGVNIPSEKGLAGHSDADVLVHAICDAILGAMGADDIGCLFPDTDPLYENISSLILLEKVYTLMSMQGYVINNVDTTIILEEPKIRPYVKEMEQNMAHVLHLDKENFNIKAKTNEGMGFIGQKEGIAAFAVVILEKV